MMASLVDTSCLRHGTPEALIKARASLLAEAKAIAATTGGATAGAASGAATAGAATKRVVSVAQVAAYGAFVAGGSSLDRAGGGISGEEAFEIEAGRAAELLLGSIMAGQQSWKATGTFVKPMIWFERDPLFALFLLVALLVFGLGHFIQARIDAEAILDSTGSEQGGAGSAGIAAATAALLGAAAGR